MTRVSINFYEVFPLKLNALTDLWPTDRTLLASDQCLFAFQGVDKVVIAGRVPLTGVMAS